MVRKSRRADTCLSAVPDKVKAGKSACALAPKALKTDMSEKFGELKAVLHRASSSGDSNPLEAGVV